MKIFGEIAQLERAAALGALQDGDCVCVDPSLLRSLGDDVRARLSRDVAASGARLCPASAPAAAVVYGVGERCPPDCPMPNGAAAPRAARP